jgi:hypothetical protein
MAKYRIFGVYRWSEVTHQSRRIDIIVDADNEDSAYDLALNCIAYSGDEVDHEDFGDMTAELLDSDDETDIGEEPVYLEMQRLGIPSLFDLDPVPSP